MENRLKELGFTGFVNLNKEQRDGIKRMAWSGEYKNSSIMIIVKEIDDGWVLEKIKHNYLEQDIDELIKNKSDLESLITFIKNKCQSTMQ